MKKLLSLFLLVVFFNNGFSQEATKKETILYIVDKVPVIDEPNENSGNVTNDDIEEVTVIKDKEKINLTGYSVDKLIYVTTKEYKKRPEEIKNIPTTKLMDQKDGAWFLKGATTPYSGKFIDYFLNGKIQGEGVLKNGIVDGARTTYYLNGSKRYTYTYRDGMQSGESEEYFTNGKIKQKGSFFNRKQIGLWQRFYSTGELKDQMMFVNEKPQLSKEQKKFYNLQDKATELMKEEDYKAAIRKLDDAEKINNKYSDLYFDRGTSKLDNMDFDTAVLDLDKAIELEPLYMEAIANRAFARIRKYQFKNSRTLSKTSKVTILASKDKVDIPKDDLAKICADLQKCYELGNKKDMILDAMKDYCK